MSDGIKPNTVYYKRAHFSSQLRIDFLYTPSHCWLEQQTAARWRVGLTKFATRMLGELVDYAFELEPGSAVRSGQTIGWIEGFKAISDIHCVLDGTFVCSNPVLSESLTAISHDPHGSGWLYEAQGQPDSKCMAVDDYIKLLDLTIDQMRGKRKGAENA